MNSERMSFDEACRDLGITEEELEQLVAAGEIATIKEGDTLYFKKDVVRKFKQKKDDSAILLSDDEISLLDDSSVEEIDLLADDDATDETTTPVQARPAAASRPGMPAKPAHPVKPAAVNADDLEISLDSDDDIPSLNLDSDDELVGIESTPEAQKAMAGGGGDQGDETLLNMDGLLEEDSEGTTPIPADTEDATLLDTDVLDLAGDADPFNADTAEETSATDLTEAGTLLRSGGARVMQMKRKSGNPAMTILLAAATLLLFLPLGTLTHVIFTSSADSKTGTAPKDSFGWINEYNFLQGAVESVADMIKPPK